MSRTDKDRPYWVRVGDPREKRVEHHDHRPIYRLCVTGERDGAWGNYKVPIGYRVATPVECDIEDFDPSPRWWRGGTRCDYSLVQESPYSSCPRDYIRTGWTKPERQRERINLRAIAREYNAGEDVEDVDFENPQHRHRTAWYYW